MIDGNLFFFIFFRFLTNLILLKFWCPSMFFNLVRNFPASWTYVGFSQKMKKIRNYCLDGEGTQRRRFFAIWVNATANSIGHDNRTLNEKK